MKKRLLSLEKEKYVCISTGHFLGSSNHFKNSKMWSISLIQNSRNQISNNWVTEAEKVGEHAR